MRAGGKVRIEMSKEQRLPARSFVKHNTLQAFTAHMILRLTGAGGLIFTACSMIRNRRMEFTFVLLFVRHFEYGGRAVQF